MAPPPEGRACLSTVLVDPRAVALRGGSTRRIACVQNCTAQQAVVHLGLPTPSQTALGACLKSVETFLTELRTCSVVAHAKSNSFLPDHEICLLLFCTGAVYRARPSHTVLARCARLCQRSRNSASEYFEVAATPTAIRFGVFEFTK